MTPRPGWLAWLLVAGLFAVLFTDPMLTIADDPPAAASPPAEKREPLVLEETPEKLDAPRTEAQQDRLHAATLFAQGRILNQRGKHAEALAKFERAWRYDQDSKTVLEELVPLAVRLNRLDEAARYAIIAIEKGARLEPRTLQQLAMDRSQNQEWEDALVLYQKLHDLQKASLAEGDQPDISMILAQLELGRIHFLLENYKQSAEAFAVVRAALEEPEKYHLNESLRKMILDEPDRTYLLLGESFLRGGRPDDAEAMFRKVAEAKPQPEVLDFRLARVTAARGKTDEALEQLDKYFQAKSSLGGSEPYKLLAELLRKKHDEQEAQAKLLQRLQKLYADDPANPGLAYFLAEQYLQAERLDDAEAIYREQAMLNPAVNAYAGLIEIYRRQEQPEKLLAVLGEAAAAEGSLDRHEEETAAIVKNEKLLDRLIEQARTQKAGGPEMLGEGVALTVGALAMKGKKFDAAHEFFALAAERETPGLAAVLSEWGLESFFAGEYEKAAEIFQRAIDEQVNPDNDAAYYFYLANALAFAERPDEALTAALQAEQLSPENPRFESRVAWINYHARRYGAAEREYTELLDKIGDDYTSDQMRQLVREAKLILSNICIQQDRYQDGVEWLEQVLDEFPRDPGALNDLGYVWSEKGVRLERSLRMVQEAVQAEPENAAYQDSLGWALFRLGRHEESLKHLEKAVELQGEEVDGVILDHLGDVRMKLNQKEQALDAWRRAAAAFGKQADTKELEKVQKKIAEHK